VDALEGKPGVHSARFGGEPKSDQKNNQTLLNALIKETNRGAYYYCALVLVRSHDDPQPIIAEGIWTGEILAAPRGNGGFGYDPLFLDVKLGKTGAELSSETKNIISHRGQALRQLIEKIKAMKQ
jgi:XTP/dITP diphosphohydrolase